MQDPVVGKNRALREAIAYALDTPASSTRCTTAAASRSCDDPARDRRQRARRSRRSGSSTTRDGEEEAGRSRLPRGKGLPTITIDYRASTTLSRHDFEFVRAKLAESGITVNANFQTFSAFLQKVEAGNFQMPNKAAAPTTRTPRISMR